MFWLRKTSIPYSLCEKEMNKIPRTFKFFEAYEPASWLESAATNPSSFIEMPWGSEQFTKALGYFSKLSLLHHYIFHLIKVEKEREYRKNYYDRGPEYIDEFRDKELVQELSRKIKQISRRNITIMEVCGGHTMAIHKFGIPSLLPGNIELLSGPGCPVCVTDIKFIDRAVAYSRLNDTIITTYGDLIRVPGSSSSLDKEKADGADIRVVYSTMEALDGVVVSKPIPRNITFLFLFCSAISRASIVE